MLMATLRRHQKQYCCKAYQYLASSSSSSPLCLSERLYQHILPIQDLMLNKAGTFLQQIKWIEINPAFVSLVKVMLTSTYATPKPIPGRQLCLPQN